jgi:pimeloyl-ACP methyl ester carboxylesterase
MRLQSLAVVLGFLVVSPIHAAETKTTQWNGYDQLTFTFENRAALLVQPKKPAEGKPWIWRAEFFGHEPQADLDLLAAGWHVAYFKVSDMYGAPAAVEAMAKFHGHLVTEYALSHRAVLEGFSRGGLYAVNYAAAHPDHTAALYLDAPVLDIRSWPGGKGKGSGNAKCWTECLSQYGLTEDTARDFRGNPLDHAAALAKSGIPVISVCGDADEAVPLEENTKIFEERYRAAGGKIEVILKPGGKHHPHSLKDPKPIVDFLLQNSLRNR